MPLPLLLAPLALAPPPTADCHYDRSAVLALDEDRFDQDPTGGWRRLSDRGCNAEAADLLRDYRAARPRERPTILYWHEGQLRAELGQYDRAAALFRHSYEPAADDVIGWNYYVDGTLAFLQGDRAHLQAARAALAMVPKPRHLAAHFVNGRRVRIAWPPNLDVLDGFLRCLGKSYAEAYGSDACSPPSRSIPTESKRGAVGERPVVSP